MELTELLQRRLKIALNAAQNDPANTESMKTVFAVLTESLWHHSTALELVESELASKVGDAQFKRALSGKLSVKEFLGYFQKIERVVEKMQNYWASNEQKTAELLERQSQKLHLELGDAIQSRMCEYMDRLENCEGNSNDFQEQKRKIAIVQSEIYDLQKKTKAFVEQIGKKQSNPKQQLEQQKMKTVLTGLKEIQTFFNETHYQMKSLIENIIKQGSEKVAIPSSTSNQRLEVLDMRIIRCEEVLPNRWVWDWNPHAHLCSWESRAGRKNITFEKIQENIGKFIIKSGGFYKFTIGYLMDSQSQNYGNLRLSCNNRILCNIDFEGNGNNCLCKTTMLYSWISNNGVVTIEIENSSNTRGFLQIENFD